VHPRSERNLSFSNFYIIWLTRGAGRYKYLNSKLIACKRMTASRVDKQIGTTL